MGDPPLRCERARAGVAAEIAVGLALLVLALLLTVSGCGEDERDTVEPPPADWDQIWSFSDLDDPAIMGVVIDVPAGHVRILVKQNDPTDEFRIGLKLEPLDPEVARKQTIELTHEEWPYEPRPGTAWHDVRTTEEVLPGKYRLEWDGDGVVDVTVFVSW